MSNIDLKNPVIGSPLIDLEARVSKTLFRDVGLNDSDKTVQVPVGKQWDILWVWVNFVSTATAGNRVLELRINDNTNDQLVISALALHAANLTYDYLFVPGAPLVGAPAAGLRAVTVPIPSPLRLRDFWTLRVLDRSAIDAAADDMTVVVVGIENTTGAAL